jgi:hypothetical protein
MNNSLHVASIHASNNRIIRSDLLHIVRSLKVAYGTLWKLRRMIWIRNVEEIGLYISETSGWNFISKLPAESAETLYTYIIHPPVEVYSGCSHTERS